MEACLLAEDEYVDFGVEVRRQADALYAGCGSPAPYAERAFHFVRDEIQHAFDVNAQRVTASALDVLRHGVGICHAKSALLVALLRCKGIPAGFRFQKLTLADDASRGHCIHAYVAAFLDGKWVELDARGNREGIDARFSTEEPKLAFYPRTEYGEYTCRGVFARPHLETMRLLETAPDMGYVYRHMPVAVTQTPAVDM